MTNLSKFGQEILMSVRTEKIKRSSQFAEYNIKVGDTSDTYIMESKFSFPSPIPEEQVNQKLPEIFSILERNLSSENLGIISAVLSKYGLAKKVTETKVTGKAPFATEPSIGLEAADALSIRTTSGMFISKGNFVSLVNLLFRGHMMDHMTSAGPQLHNRTGRFIATSSIKDVKLLKSATTNKTVIQLTYSYLEKPYSVFDPKNGNPLASNSRDPNKIISDAILKALQGVVSEKFYSINIRGM